MPFTGKQNLPSFLMFFHPPFHPRHHWNNAVQMRMKTKFVPSVKQQSFPFQFLFSQTFEAFPKRFQIQGIIQHLWAREALWFCSTLLEA